MRYESVDQSEFLEERRQKDLVSGLTWLPRETCYVPDGMRTTWKLPVDVASKSFPGV